MIAIVADVDSIRPSVMNDPIINSCGCAVILIDIINNWTS